MGSPEQVKDIPCRLCFTSFVNLTISPSFPKPSTLLWKILSFVLQNNPPIFCLTATVLFGRGRKDQFCFLLSPDCQQPSAEEEIEFWSNLAL